MKDGNDHNTNAGDGADDSRFADDALAALAGAVPRGIPPLPPDLDQELADLKPVKLRRPRISFVKIVVVSLLYGAGILWLLDLRPDLSGLSSSWMALYCSAWVLAFLGVGWFTLVPGPGKIMPNWRYAGLGAILTGVGFVLAGLIFHRSVPELSHVCSHDLAEFVYHGDGCMRNGLITAFVPVLLGALLLRGTLPVGSRWVGAGLGAAGGSLGGLLLHLHCHYTSAMHLGFVHGGVVVVAAVLGALIIPRFTRP